MYKLFCVWLEENITVPTFIRSIDSEKIAHEICEILNELGDCFFWIETIGEEVSTEHPISEV
jgi:hypothetical protein